MHVLILPSWHMPHGGFVRNQARVLKEKGLTVNVLANVHISLTHDKTKYFTSSFCTFISEEDDLMFFRHNYRSLPKLQVTNAKLWAKSTVKLFEKYQQKFGKPDIIHVHSAFWGGYAAHLIKEKYNIPYIITEHGGIFGLFCDYAKNRFVNWYTPLLEKAFSNADYITPVSNNQIAKIKTFLTKEVPINPVTNVINTDFFHYKERRKNTEKITFVTVNGFYIPKAYDILLPAFDKACAQNTNLEIRIVGENFNSKAFKPIWNNVVNKDKFYFTGELTANGVREELWNADCYIMPSRSEGQPQATLEALCTGLPMVCTEVVPHSVTTKENSIIIPVENIEKMTDAILKLSNTYKNYDNKAISEHIKNICGKEAFAKAIIDVYEQVINKK